MPLWLNAECYHIMDACDILEMTTAFSNLLYPFYFILWHRCHTYTPAVYQISIFMNHSRSSVKSAFRRIQQWSCTKAEMPILKVE